MIRKLLSRISLSLWRAGGSSMLRWSLAILAVVALCRVTLLLSQEKQPPVSLQQLMEWVGSAEANRPSEEIIEAMRKFGTDFELSPASEVQIRTRAEGAGRPADLVRQVLQAAKENWILDR